MPAKPLIFLNHPCGMYHNDLAGVGAHHLGFSFRFIAVGLSHLNELCIGPRAKAVFDDGAELDADPRAVLRRPPAKQNGNGCPAIRKTLVRNAFWSGTKQMVVRLGKGWEVSQSCRCRGRTKLRRAKKLR
jgi:hypothetical protein